MRVRPSKLSLPTLHRIAHNQTCIGCAKPDSIQPTSTARCVHAITSASIARASTYATRCGTHAVTGTGAVASHTAAGAGHLVDGEAERLSGALRACLAAALDVRLARINGAEGSRVPQNDRRQ